VGQDGATIPKRGQQRTHRRARSAGGPDDERLNIGFGAHVASRLQLQEERAHDGSGLHNGSGWDVRIHNYATARRHVASVCYFRGRCACSGSHYLLSLDLGSHTYLQSERASLTLST
jgi:hypothetical protein